MARKKGESDFQIKGSVWAEFEKTGKRLFKEGLIGGNFGNMSLLEDEVWFWITRSGSYLDDPKELIRMQIMGDAPSGASSEWRVHRSIYSDTSFSAIVHAHPPYSVAASLCYERIVPIDSEGKMFCPVIQVAVGDPGTEALAKNVTACIKQSGLCIARGHGTFAAAKTLEEAYLFTSLTEHACKVLAFTQIFNSGSRNPE